MRFDQFHNIVFHDRVEIGNGVFTRVEVPIIVGPRHVERREFEGDDNINRFGPNGNEGSAYRPDAVTAARARDGFDRMTDFQAIVNEFLVKPRIDSKGFQ